MTDKQTCPLLTEEDFRAALKEIKTYVDITEEDLKKIYEIAFRYAQRRVASEIPVKEIMTTNVVTVKGDAELREAAQLLSDHKISGMPVVDDDNHVVGVISEADLLLFAGIKKRHIFKDYLHNILGEPSPVQAIASDKVERVMAAPAFTIKPDDDIKTAAAIMSERRIKRLPVTDAEEKLIGIISRADIVRAAGKKTEGV